LAAAQAFANLQLNFPSTKLGTGTHNVVGNVSADAMLTVDGTDVSRIEANVIFEGGSPLNVSLVWAYDTNPDYNLEFLIGQEGAFVAIRDVKVYLTCPEGSPQLTYSRGVNNQYAYNLGTPFPTNLPTSMPVFATLECASPPLCQVSVGSLDFGTTAPDAPVERSFTISNTGGGTLSGEVTEACEAYSISNGVYALAGGQSQTVTVTLQSASMGNFPCTLDTGGSCADISLSGTVDLPAVCEFSAPDLDFGTVLPGTPVVRTFSVMNSGGGTLSGEVTEVCDTYSVSNGVYSLGAGQSHTVTVTFQSATAGSFPCTLDGGGSCPDLSLTGAVELAPACQVSTASLDFGTVLPDTPVERSFTISNTGGGTLTGTVTEACDTYSVTNGAYSLTAGQLQTVTVTFQSAVDGSFPCTLDTGGACADISLTGAVEQNPPVCALDVDSLDFGTTLPGTPVERTFTISNTGGGTLAGTVTESCEAYSVGNGVYSLTAGQSQLVSVTLVSATAGDFPCTLDTGGACADLNLTGVVELAPACQLSTAAVDLGLLLPDEIANGAFTITNVGGGTLSGTASLDCEGFAFTGPVDFALTAGQSQDISFDFFSPEPGEYTCRINTTGGCGQVQVTAVVEPAPQCVVGASLLDFGTTTPGTPVERTFTVSNAGGHTLSGEVTEACDNYAVTNGVYSLGAGQSQTVTVTFQGAAAGSFPCALVTGGDCAGVTLAAEVELAPACQLSAGTIELGLLLPGEIATGDFSITNVGGGTLSGTVGMDCPGFAFTGPVAYSLGAGQSQLISFDFFSDTPGLFTCEIDASSSCGPVQVLAEVQPAPQCQVSASALDFGTVQPDSPAELTLTLTNSGGHTLSGALSESCPAFEVLGGSSYSLGAGQSQDFVLRFQAAATDEYTCVLDTGGDCADVTLTAVVDPLPACEVSVAALDFGTVLPNAVATRTFSITNTGGGTLAGAVLESCPAFAVSNGAYSLAAGQSQTVTVTFQSTSAGDYTCTLDTGGSCADIDLQGTVELSPACQLSVASLDFGTAAPDTPVSRTFSITNTGGGLLEGVVTEDCAAYSVANGSYSLATGQSHVVTVTFQSADEGSFPCQLDTGSDCAALPLTALVDNPPICQLSVTGLDFGTLLPGSTVERSFTISNVGGGVLAGAMAETCPAYSVVNGTYSLGAGQSQTVTVTFHSEAPGSYPCVLDTDSSCPDLGLTAVAASLQLFTGEQSACGTVDVLGHLPGSELGFVQDWENGEIGLALSSMGGGTLTVSVLVDNGSSVSVWSGAVGSGIWEAAESGVDLEDWFTENVTLYLEVSDGTSTWNSGGAECLWDLNFLAVENDARPLAFLLHEAAPNPFNPATHLLLDLPEPDHARVVVRDLQGRQVAVLLDGELSAGRHNLTWQPGQVASGTYFVTLECRQGVQVRKVLFLK